MRFIACCIKPTRVIPTSNKLDKGVAFFFMPSIELAHHACFVGVFCDERAGSAEDTARDA
jgi:hypothetical protein